MQILYKMSHKQNGLPAVQFDILILLYTLNYFVL